MNARLTSTEHTGRLIKKKEQPIPIPEVFERARGRERERERESKRETDIGDSHRGIAGNTLTPHDHAVALSR